MARNSSDNVFGNFGESLRNNSEPSTNRNLDEVTVTNIQDEVQSNIEALNLFGPGGDRSKRVATLTEKGKSYTRDVLFRNRKSLYCNFQKQMKFITSLLNLSHSMTVIRCELSKLDEIFCNLMAVQENFIALVENCDQHDIEIRWFEVVDKEVMDFKTNIHNHLSQAKNLEDSKSVTSLCSKSSKKSRKSSSSTATSSSLKSSKGSRKSGSSVRERVAAEKARIAELHAESKFLEERRAAEIASEKVRIKQEMAKAEARVKVFEEFEDSIRCEKSVTEEVADQDGTFYKNERISRSYVKNWITANGDVTNQPGFLQRQRIEPSRVQLENLSKQQQQQTVSFGMRRPECSQPYVPKMPKEELPQQPNLGNHFINEPREDTEGIDESTLHAATIYGLLNQQNAPNVDIDVFGGDPIEYQCFMTTFQEVVEKKIADPMERDELRAAEFIDFVNLIEEETRLVNDPLYSREALSEVQNSFKDRFRREMAKDTKMSVYSTDYSSTETDRVYEPKSSCPSCEGLHDLDKCPDYLKLDVKERSKFLYENKLCYACYKPTSPTHVSKSCRQRRMCNICTGSHPTGLHGFKFTKRSENDETKQDHLVCNLATVDAQVISLSVIPVRIGAKNGNQEMIVYAMLDNCSQGTFIQEDILNALKVKGVRTTVTVKTMTGEATEESISLDNLTVSGLGSADRETISLPKTYSRKELPIQRDDILTPDKLRHWPHLKDIMKDLHKEDSEIPVGLLIGANCPLALEPHEIIPSQDGGPYAFRSCLGWCISGPIIKSAENEILVRCNRIAVSDAGSTKIAEHHFVVEDAVKDVTINEILTKMYHTDFSEAKLNDENLNFSQEDKKFLELMKERGYESDGHYVLPLPFRNPHVCMPNNRDQAMKRAKWTKRRLQKDPTFYNDYIKFMNDIIGKGYAKKVEANYDIPGKQWYIPHHGVYHPKKPEKIRVVFDCSAQYEGTCLNKELLQGLDLTNQLVGVLFAISLVARRKPGIGTYGL
eukprot:gene4020-4569_t